MGWFGVCGELMGSAAATFVRISAKLKQKELTESNDFWPDETKQFILKSLKSCRPASKDLTWWGRKIKEFNLVRNDYFGSLLGIDANTKSTKQIERISQFQIPSEKSFLDL